MILNPWRGGIIQAEIDELIETKAASRLALKVATLDGSVDNVLDHNSYTSVVFPVSIKLNGLKIFIANFGALYVIENDLICNRRTLYVIIFFISGSHSLIYIIFFISGSHSLI